jgi:hypothetical protein
MKSFRLKIFYGLFLLFLIPILNLSAQSTDAGGTFVNISVNPANPAPGEQVQVSLQSFSLDLDRSLITWSVNGVEKKTENGSKDYFIQAGPAGKMMTVSAKIKNQDKTFTKEASFIPAGVDLIFQSFSYTPPFYKGKALNPSQGNIVVVAFPEIFSQTGKKYSTKELIYSWRRDDLVQASASGVGKNSFTFSGSVPVRDEQVSVTVSTLDQTITANNNLTITTDQPKIIFYENSPVYGIMLNKAIKNTVKMLTDEFGVIAVPYFYSVGYAATPDLDYLWSLNGQKVENQEIKNTFTTRQEKKGSGVANIGLKISNNVRIFQFSNANYTINFEKQ